MVLGGFAVITILTKNSVLEEIRKQYVLTARAKGVAERDGAVAARVPQRADSDHDRISRRPSSARSSAARC